MDDPKRNYFYKKNDIRPNSELLVGLEDDRVLSVKFDNLGNISSITDESGNPVGDAENSNVQFQAGAEIGQAISGENLNEDNSGGRMGYVVGSIIFSFKKYPEHKALESAIEYASKNNLPVQEIFKDGGKVTKGEIVWSPRGLNESKITRKQIRNLISECIKEIITERYIEERNKVKYIIRPLIREMILGEYGAGPRNPEVIKNVGLKKFLDELNLYLSQRDDVSILNYKLAPTDTRAAKIEDDAFIIKSDNIQALIFARGGKYGIVSVTPNPKVSHEDRREWHLSGKIQNFVIPQNDAQLSLFIEDPTNYIKKTNTINNQKIT